MQANVDVGCLTIDCDSTSAVGYPGIWRKNSCQAPCVGVDIPRDDVRPRSGVDRDATIDGATLLVKTGGEIDLCRYKSVCARQGLGRAVGTGSIAFTGCERSRKRQGNDEQVPRVADEQIAPTKGLAA